LERANIHSHYIRNREQLLVMSGEYGVNVPLRRG